MGVRAGISDRSGYLFFSFFFFFFRLTYSRWASTLPSCLYLWSLRIFPSPRFTPYDFLSRCKFSTIRLTTRQLTVEFYLLTFSRFPLRKKKNKSYSGKNRTHDSRTSRCAGYLLLIPLGRRVLETRTISCKDSNRANY